MFRKATVAGFYCGSQDLDQWVTLGHSSLQLLFSAPFPGTVFQIPHQGPICLEPMHFPLKTHLFCTCQRVSLWWSVYPIELSIASIPEDDLDAIFISVHHSSFISADKDCRANMYINETLCQKRHIPVSVHLEYLSFCINGQFCRLAQGNRGFIVVKRLDQRTVFENLRLFNIITETLPKFLDLRDHGLPDHLHDYAHEYFDISECIMVKSYRFSHYVHQFNKLQAECNKQTANLVEERNNYTKKRGPSQHKSRLVPTFFKTHNMSTLECSSLNTYPKKMHLTITFNVGKRQRIGIVSRDSTRV
ncbi:hypothetical protein TNCV_3596961 [Trichonephila clavipes]|nr:hypothetical protein TNCV_3596961 [Trichonephila clavipes]